MTTLARTLLLVAVAAVSHPLAAQSTGATPAAQPHAPKVYFHAPKDGAVVEPDFKVVFGLRDYGVAPAGVKLANTGHFHVLIDAEPGPAGSIVPADSSHRHFGAGQIESRLTLAPGAHTLLLVLADADHRVIGPPLISKPIRITVRKKK